MLKRQFASISSSYLFARLQLFNLTKLKKYFKQKGAAHVELALVMLLVTIILSAVVTQILELQRQYDQETSTLSAMQQVIHAYSDTIPITYLDNSGNNSFMPSDALRFNLTLINQGVRSIYNVPGLMVRSSLLSAERSAANLAPSYTEIMSESVTVSPNILDISNATIQNIITNQVPIAVTPERTILLAVAAGTELSKIQILAAVVGVQTEMEWSSNPDIPAASKAHK